MLHEENRPSFALTEALYNMAQRSLTYTIPYRKVESRGFRAFLEKIHVLKVRYVVQEPLNVSRNIRMKRYTPVSMSYKKDTL